MKSNIIKKTAAASAFGLITLLGTSEIASAQNRNQTHRQRQNVEKQQQKVEKQRQKVENQREKLERERIELNRQRQRAEQARFEQQRQQQIRQQNQRNRSANANSNNNNRYRVYRNGGYYQTDNRGAELLRQAVNRGYQEGVRAGQADRSNRRGSGYHNSSIYRNGNYGYQSRVDASQYQYYFRQGFERGYEDGFNSRYRYGSNSGGALNILGAVLQGILNIQAY